MAAGTSRSGSGTAGSAELPNVTQGGTSLRFQCIPANGCQGQNLAPQFQNCSNRLMISCMLNVLHHCTCSRLSDIPEEGEVPPLTLQGAQPRPSHCLPHAKRQLQWHL